MRKISGNEAVALAAVNAGAAVIAGYPGTPSSETVASLWDRKIEGVHVEWSTNEKVALEIASAASWAGKRAMCCMKMSGLNVAYDSLISIAYSGLTGALVIYVCDDPGVSAGMPEQDVRGFAKMTDIPVIDLGSVEESYTLTKYAFELSERTGTPVMLRSVTNVALSHSTLDLPELTPSNTGDPKIVKDASKYTKAGAVICLTQHQDLIDRLAAAEKIVHEDNLNPLTVKPGAHIGLVAAGVCAAYIKEGKEIAAKYGFDEEVSTLIVRTSIPCPRAEVNELFKTCDTIVVVEENEPYVEHGIVLEAFKAGKKVRILGKEDGTLSRLGNFDATTIANALLASVGKKLPESFAAPTGAEKLCAKRPIGVCSGCPHRGVFMAINDAVRKLGYKKDEVMVTGDIGCTILGMSPPFDTLWTEVSMGASIPMAQGFVHAGLKTPVFATIGDSTFIHGGISGLINAVQHDVNMTAIIMDNGWTGMTGMQVNPNTAKEFQQSDSHVRVDIANIVPALGVEHFAIADPYDYKGLTELITTMAKLPGVKVILARRECAIQAGRRRIRYSKVHIDQDKCTRCKVCILRTGCPALVFDGKDVSIDPKQCNGCGICSQVCAFKAIIREEIK